MLAPVQLILFIINIGFLLGAVGIISLSLVCLLMFKLTVSWVFLGAGVFIGVMALLGLVGSRATKEAAILKMIVVIYFFSGMFIFLLTSFTGLVFLIAKNLALTYVCADELAFRHTFDDVDRAFPNSHIDFAIAVVEQKIAPFTTTLGWVGIIMSLGLIAATLCTGYTLTFKVIAMSLLGFQNTLTALCGVGIAIVGVYAVTELPSDVPLWMPALGIVAGVIVAFTSILGCIGACLKNRCALLVYAGVLALCVLLMCCIAIGVFVFAPTLYDFVQKFRRISELMVSTFPFIATWSQTEKDRFVAPFLNFVFNLLAVGAVVFGLFMVWSLVAVIFLIVKFGQHNDDGILAQGNPSRYKTMAPQNLGAGHTV